LRSVIHGFLFQMVCISLFCRSLCPGSFCIFCFERRKFYRDSNSEQNEELQLY
jgi:hypothetical protein